MSRFFDDLEAQLREAAVREVAGPAPGRAPRRPARPRWGWVSSGLRAAPVALAVLLTVGVVGGAFVLLHGSRGGNGGGGAGGGPAGGGPAGGLSSVITPRIRREMRYIDQADRQVMFSPACGGSPADRVRQQASEGRPRVARGRPGPALLGLLGVLHRPATPADHLSRAALGAGEYLGSERLARVLDGHRYYVAAARMDTSGQPAPRCLTAQRRALQRLAPSIPSDLRAGTERLQTEIIGYARRIAHPQDVACLIDVASFGGGSGSSGSCGETIAELRGVQGDGLTVGQGPDGPPGLATTIMRDGIASVTLHYPASRGHAAFSATGTVVNNVLAIQLPRWTGLSRDGFSPQADRVVLRAASGRVLRRIDLGNPQQALAAQCRRDPVPCLLVLGGTTTTSTSGSSVRTRPLVATMTASASASASTSSGG